MCFVEGEAFNYASVCEYEIQAASMVVDLLEGGGEGVVVQDVRFVEGRVFHILEGRAEVEEVEVPASSTCESLGDRKAHTTGTASD